MTSFAALRIEPDWKEPIEANAELASPRPILG
jgi:hypothetical protein